MRRTEEGMISQSRRGFLWKSACVEKETSKGSQSAWHYKLSHQDIPTVPLNTKLSPSSTCRALKLASNSKKSKTFPDFWTSLKSLRTLLQCDAMFSVRLVSAVAQFKTRADFWASISQAFLSSSNFDSLKLSIKVWESEMMFLDENRCLWKPMPR